MQTAAPVLQLDVRDRMLQHTALARFDAAVLLF
jgi:hypothetical protein